MNTEQEQKPLPVGITQEEMDRVNKIERKVYDARLPGETWGWSVFRITFDDGCRYHGYTSKVIAWKVDELCNFDDPLADPWLVIHNREMGKTLECLASGLRQGEAMSGKNRVVDAAQAEAEARTQVGETKICPISRFLNDYRMDMMRTFHQRMQGGHTHPITQRT